MKYLFSNLIFFVLMFFQIFVYGQTIEFSAVTPIPDSKYLNPEQNIILKTDNALEQNSIKSTIFKIKGTKSGLNNFTIILSNDKKTLILKPLKKFNLGEKVSVSVINGLKTIEGKKIQGIDFSFLIKKQDNIQFLKEYYQDEEKKFFDNNSRKNGVLPDIEKIKFYDVPVDFPLPTFVLGDNLDDNYYFMDLSSRQNPLYSPYHAIFDKFGTPIFYQRLNSNHMNFYVLPNGVLTYSSNFPQNPENEKYYLMDSSYVIIDSVRTGNGYNVDSHDMRLMSNGHFLMMSYDPQVIDMSLIVPGGQHNAIVTGLIIQEVDLNENVFFQWRSWDYFEITDAIAAIDLTKNKIDYVHGNALEFDLDSNILLSCRNMDEITKINYPAGDIIWRFGRYSENNQFVINNDPIGFSHQHDIRVLDNGNYTLFDNGNFHTPVVSQAMEYAIDENTINAELVWSYRHNPDIYAPATGCFRVQDNGKKLIGWGANMPLVATELNPDLSISTEIYLPMDITCYRTLKYPWETNLFYTEPEIHFGNYKGNSGGKELLLYITNNSDDNINITSTHNHLSEYTVISNFPITISPDSSSILKIVFEPTEEGEYNDLLTINYDNIDNSRRIARQAKLFGLWNNNLPSVFFDPENGSINVNPDTEIYVNFDEPIRKIFGAQIQNSDIPLIFELKKENSEGDKIDFTGIISEDNMHISIFPDNILNSNQQYYLELKKNRVEDYEGNIINYAEISYFTTGDITSITENCISSVSVVPNPFSKSATIIIDKDNNRKVKLEIYDMRGKLVFQDYFFSRSYQLSSTNLSKGIYVLKIIYDKEIIKKLIVQ